MMNDVPDETSIGIKVKLLKDYGVVCESLERMGIMNRDEKLIYPSCYCHKVETDDGIQYSICHFKEFFPLQNRPSTFNKKDSLRRATITYLLQKWNLIEVCNPEEVSKILTDKIDVVKYSEKRDYKIIHKYHATRSKKNE